MRMQPAITALKGPLAVVVILLALFVFICFLPAGGHPDGKGLVLFVYVFDVLPILSLIGLLLSIITCVRKQEFRVPAIMLCALYLAILGFCAALHFRWLHLFF